MQDDHERDSDAAPGPGPFGGGGDFAEDLDPPTGVAPRLAYCTNVHAGTSLEAIRRMLEDDAASVAMEVPASGGPVLEALDLGLWLSGDVARELAADPAKVERLRDSLEASGLCAVTLNGFPYGDFHAERVKLAVYEPAWDDPARLEHTKRLVDLLAALLPADLDHASISTLPLGWRELREDGPRRARAVDHLLELARHAMAVRERSGRRIHLDLEPEPGCAIDRAGDLAAFLAGVVAREPGAADHLGACLDVCHAAVMREGAGAFIDEVTSAGLAIGKVQVSSAVHAPFRDLDAAGRAEALDELRGFAEDRYLHQTMVEGGGGAWRRLVTDLPDALAGATADSVADEDWFVHFHVPIDLDAFGRLRSTQDEILLALAALHRASGGDGRAWPMLEVETYAWNVLPDDLQPESLTDGIADELIWLFHAVDGIRRIPLAGEPASRPTRPR